MRIGDRIPPAAVTLDAAARLDCSVVAEARDRAVIDVGIKVGRTCGAVTIRASARIGHMNRLGCPQLGPQAVAVR